MLQPHTLANPPWSCLVHPHPLFLFGCQGVGQRGRNPGRQKETVWAETGAEQVSFRQSDQSPWPEKGKD